MTLKIFSGTSNRPLAEEVAANLRTQLGQCALSRFPDGELHVEILESVRGDDVYLVQSTSPPVADHLLELLLLADACRRAGAAHLTAVIPYFGYARQDRRATGREPVSARLIADTIEGSGFERVIAVDPHTAALEGFFEIPLEQLSAVPTLVEAARLGLAPNSVIVGPDLGAAKLADRYAHPLQLPVAIVHKTRISGGAVSVSGITGDVRGRAPIIVDDMISTGGTIEAAIQTVLSADCLPEITVVATHGLFVGSAMQRLRGLPVKRLVVANTVTPPPAQLPLEVVSIAPLLADVIDRLHRDESINTLIAYR